MAVKRSLPGARRASGCVFRRILRSHAPKCCSCTGKAPLPPVPAEKGDHNVTPFAADKGGASGCTACFWLRFPADRALAGTEVLLVHRESPFAGGKDRRARTSAPEALSASVCFTILRAGSPTPEGTARGRPRRPAAARRQRTRSAPPRGRRQSTQPSPPATPATIRCFVLR